MIILPKMIERKRGKVRVHTHTLAIWFVCVRMCACVHVWEDFEAKQVVCARIIKLVQ